MTAAVPPALRTVPPQRPIPLPPARGKGERERACGPHPPCAARIRLPWPGSSTRGPGRCGAASFQAVRAAAAPRLSRGFGRQRLRAFQGGPGDAFRQESVPRLPVDPPPPLGGGRGVGRGGIERSCGPRPQARNPSRMKSASCLAAAMRAVRRRHRKRLPRQRGSPFSEALICPSFPSGSRRRHSSARRPGRPAGRWARHPPASPPPRRG